MSLVSSTSSCYISSQITWNEADPGWRVGRQYVLMKFSSPKEIRVISSGYRLKRGAVGNGVSCWSFLTDANKTKTLVPLYSMNFYHVFNFPHPESHKVSVTTHSIVCLCWVYGTKYLVQKKILPLMCNEYFSWRSEAETLLFPSYFKSSSTIIGRWMILSMTTTFYFRFHKIRVIKLSAFFPKHYSETSVSIHLDTGVITLKPSRSSVCFGNVGTHQVFVKRRSLRFNRNSTSICVRTHIVVCHYNVWPVKISDG